MFVITVKYLVGLDVIDQYITEHREFLDTLYAQNILLASGPQNPRIDGGIIIALSTDKSVVEQFIKQDPFYINEVASYSIVEFNPVKHHQKISTLLNVSSPIM